MVHQKGFLSRNAGLAFQRRFSWFAQQVCHPKTPERLRGPFDKQPAGHQAVSRVDELCAFEQPILSTQECRIVLNDGVVDSPQPVVRGLASGWLALGALGGVPWGAVST